MRVWFILVVVATLLFKPASLIKLQVGEESGELVNRELKRVLEFCNYKMATEEDIKQFFTEDLNPSYNAKCLRFCVYLLLDLIQDDGRFDFEKLRVLYEVQDSNEVILALRNRMLDRCRHVRNYDDCEQSYEIMKCLADAKKEVGLDGDWW